MGNSSLGSETRIMITIINEKGNSQKWIISLRGAILDKKQKIELLILKQHECHTFSKSKMIYILLSVRLGIQVVILKFYNWWFIINRIVFVLGSWDSRDKKKKHWSQCCWTLIQKEGRTSFSLVPYRNTKLLFIMTAPSWMNDIPKTRLLNSTPLGIRFQ